MHITMTDMMPVSLCLATEELFDANRFQRNFCDYSTLRARDSALEEVVSPIKRELNSVRGDEKFMEGYKAVIISNIDKILSLATSRYSSMGIKSTEALVKEGRNLMRRVSEARSFKDIEVLEPLFKGKVLIPVYELFTESVKISQQRYSRL